MRTIVPLVVVILASACGPKGQYLELEALYNTAIEQRDAVGAERDAALDEVARVRERMRRRTEGFVSVYEGLLEVEGKDLATVRIEDGRAVLQLDADVLFDSGSAQLTEAGAASVAAIADILASANDARFQIEGHTDSEPIDSREFPSNWHLGADRAIHVLLAMVDAGMPPDRIQAASRADQAPVASNEDPEGRAENRRIEIVVLPDLTEMLPYKRMISKTDAAGE